MHTASRDSLAAAIHIAFHHAAVDVNHTLLAHDALVAAAKHIVADDAAVDVDPRVAFHHTCRRAEVAAGVQVDATTAAVDVAFPLVARLGANLSAVDGHLGVHGDVTVLAAAKQATFY